MGVWLQRVRLPKAARRRRRIEVKKKAGTESRVASYLGYKYDACAGRRGGMRMGERLHIIILNLGRRKGVRRVSTNLRGLS